MLIHCGAHPAPRALRGLNLTVVGRSSCSPIIVLKNDRTAARRSLAIRSAGETDSTPAVILSKRTSLGNLNNISNKPTTRRPRELIFGRTNPPRRRGGSRMTEAEQFRPAPGAERLRTWRLRESDNRNRESSFQMVDCDRRHVAGRRPQIIREGRS